MMRFSDVGRAAARRWPPRRSLPSPRLPVAFVGRRLSAAEAADASVSLRLSALYQLRAFSTNGGADSSSKPPADAGRSPSDGPAAATSGPAAPATATTNSSSISSTSNSSPSPTQPPTSTPSSTAATPTATTPPSSTSSPSSSSAAAPATKPAAGNTPPSGPPHGPQRGILSQANQNISATLHYAGQSIEELEKMLMKKLNESNQRRFRFYFFGSFAGLVVLLFVFGDELRKMLSAQTADLAKETLENQELRVQTQQLAMAVVQTILNDPEVTAMAASFLREASTAPETQVALLDLVVHVLQHPQSLDELTTIARQLIARLSADPAVQAQLVGLVNHVLTDPAVQAQLVTVLAQLVQHPEFVSGVVVALTGVAKAPEVVAAATELVQAAAQDLLADEQVVEESRRFIADVMGDDSLQKEGGDALWNSLNYALKPGFIKITGVMLIAVSIGAFRLCVSPF